MASPATNTGFTFGSSNHTGPNAAPFNGTAAPAPFSFSSASSFSFGSGAAASTDKNEPFVFGSKPAESGDKSQPFVFGSGSAEAKMAAPFVFGASGTTVTDKSYSPAGNVTTGTLLEKQEELRAVSKSIDGSAKAPDTDSKRLVHEKMAALNASFAKTLKSTGILDYSYDKKVDEFMANITDLTAICKAYIDFASTISQSKTADTKSETKAVVPGPAEKKENVGAVKMAFSFGQNPKEGSSSASAFKTVTPSFKFGTETSEPRKEEPAKPAENTPFKFSFGNTAPTTPAFKFGSETAAASTNKAITTPFTFGSSLSQDSKPAFGAAGTSSAFAAAISQGPQVTKATEEEEENDEDGDALPVEQKTEEQIAKLKTGAGEENEDTVAEVNCKIYIYGEGGNFKEFGINILKLNKAKDGSMWRFLARQTSTGKETLNSRLSAQSTIRIEGEKKKDIMLLNPALIDGKATFVKYAIRVKDSDIASTFVKQVEKAIAELK